MKKDLFILIVLAFLFTANNSFSQQLKPIVDERVELLGIVFRLAGSDEYLNNSIENYTKKVDAFFKPYSNEPVIEYAKKLRVKRGVSYDAIMSMAIHIEIINGSVKLIDNVNSKSINDRWGKHPKKFVKELNAFYKKSEFHKFFTNNKDFYSIAEQRFLDISNSIDMFWFKSFYGQDLKGTYHLALSFVNIGNYGVKINFENGKTDIYSIICAEETDSLGLPIYSSDIINTIVHEFSHSFCNPLGNAYFSEMKSVAKGFYKIVADKMRMQAYGSAKTMVNEILVRASTIKYFQSHNVSSHNINTLIRYEQASGFLWIEPLLKALSEYENNRAKYPTLKEFMPEIVKLQNKLSPKAIAKKLEDNSPKIVSFSIENNSQDVDYQTKEIIVVYDRSMASYGLSHGTGGSKNYPKTTSMKWKNKERKELIINVELQPNKKYSLRFYEMFNQDNYGFTLDKPYELNFRTKKKVTNH